jgi:hypothetical protein
VELGFHDGLGLVARGASGQQAGDKQNTGAGNSSATDFGHVNLLTPEQRAW